MANLLGTDGNRDVRGQPTIIRDAMDHKDQEQRFFVSLFSALSFSNGFCLDAAWLTNSPLAAPLENQNSSLRRLFAKEFIHMVSRIPREEMLASFPENLRYFVGDHRVWSWPTRNAIPRRQELRMEIEKDKTVEKFIQFFPGERDQSLIMEGDRLKAKDEKFSDGFVNFSQVPVEIPTLLRKIAASHGDESLDDFAPIGETPLKRTLLTTSKQDIISALDRSELGGILGSGGEASRKRKLSCISLTKEMTAPPTGPPEDNFGRIRDHAKNVAEILNFPHCAPTDKDAISVCLADIFGFLLCWN